MKNTRISKNALALGGTVALVLATIIISGLSAKAKAQETTVKTLTRHVLSGTYYDTAPGVIASCKTTGCVATVNMYTESIS